MKPALFLVVVTFVAFPAIASAQAKDKPAAKAPAKPAATQTANARPARKSRRNEDARRCLELASNTAIIKCAEEYL